MDAHPREDCDTGDLFFQSVFNYGCNTYKYERKDTEDQRNSHTGYSLTTIICRSLAFRSLCSPVDKKLFLL